MPAHAAPRSASSGERAVLRPPARQASPHRERVWLPRAAPQPRECPYASSCRVASWRGAVLWCVCGHIDVCGEIAQSKRRGHGEPCIEVEHTPGDAADALDLLRSWRNRTEPRHEGLVIGGCAPRRGQVGAVRLSHRRAWGRSHGAPDALARVAACRPPVPHSGCGRGVLARGSRGPTAFPLRTPDPAAAARCPASRLQAPPGVEPSRTRSPAERVPPGAPVSFHAAFRAESYVEGTAATPLSHGSPRK